MGQGLPIVEVSILHSDAPHTFRRIPLDEGSGLFQGGKAAGPWYVMG